MHVAGVEELAVHGQEGVGEAVTDHDARTQGEQAGVVVGPLPDRRVAFGDVDLAEAERQEGDVPVGAGREPVEQVQVGEAGEGAAVVPGDGEGGHDTVQRRLREQHSRTDVTRPAGFRAPATNAGPARAMPMPMAAPATTSDAWCMRVWMRLLDTTMARA